KVRGKASLRYANELNNFVVRVDHVDTLRIETRLIHESLLVDLQTIGAIAAQEIGRNKTTQETAVILVEGATPVPVVAQLRDINRISIGSDPDAIGHREISDQLCQLAVAARSIGHEKRATRIIRTGLPGIREIEVAVVVEREVVRPLKRLPMVVA